MNDVDLDIAVEGAHDAIFANAGQVCCAGSRTFVQSGIHDEFVKRSIAFAKNRKVGNPWEMDTKQGSLKKIQISKNKINKILIFSISKSKIRNKHMQLLYSIPIWEIILSVR